MTKFSDIIDNRKLSLKDEISETLSGAEKVKFAVGYLYLSGFYQIADRLEKLEEAKLLIGSNINRQLMEALAETLPGDDDLKDAYKSMGLQRPLDKNRIRDNVSGSVVGNVQALPHTIKRQKEISKLVELVNAKKVKIKVYTKHPLHAKSYIFKYKSEIASAAREEGIGIIGSSNLTISGFYHNTELNTYVRGQKNYEELNEWFDRLWEEAVPFDESLMNILENSWALKTVNPYDIFILTLYHLTKASIEKQTTQIWFWENPEFMARLTARFKKMKDLYPFQKVAIMQAYGWVNKYNGVFISDVVGLGKTYIGAGLLKQSNRRALIISPPGLMDMWNEFMEKFEIDGRVLSRGMIYNGVYDKNSKLWEYRDRDIVLIDESHHFRNNDTKMYRELQPFLADKKVILMTATPQNTSVWNIYNQIKLFNQTEENTFPNRYEEPHLRNLFKKVEKGDYRLPELLQHILIRRTRRHIKEFYSDGEFSIIFPTRELETVTYNINETYHQLYNEIRTMLKKLSYARYDLWKYVKDEKKEEDPYFQLKKVIGTLRVFHKINLFKRLESSIASFRQSIDNLLHIHQKFLTIIEKKQIVPAGELIQDRIYRYELQDIWDQIEELAGDYKTEDFDTEDLIADLKSDISIFKQIQSDLKSIPVNRDVKYDKLLSIMEELKHKDKQEKILIFSEYADTVDYLFQRLDETYDAVAKVHGQTSGNSQKILAFAPKANDYEGAEGINLMTATDVLSEGHNLQDCSAVINYDLHWNPVHLIQRAGRVDRIGSEADKIYIKNFLPSDEVEDVIKLKKILEKRITEIHEHIGEDEQILSEEERINDQAMYAIYQLRDMDEVEAAEEEMFSTDETEIMIKNLMREKPEYLALIKKMQLGLRSAKNGVSYKGTFAFFRSGDFPRLFIKKPDGTILDDISEVIREIRCNPDEPEQKVSENILKDYYDDIQNLKNHFKKLISDDTNQLRIDPEIRKTKKRLRMMIDKRSDDTIFIENASKIDSVLNAYFPNTFIPILRRLNKQEENDDRYFEELVNLYNQEKLGYLSQPKEKEKQHSVEFICGELLI